MWIFKNFIFLDNLENCPIICFPRSCSSALSDYLTSSNWIWRFKTQHVRSAQCEKCLESLSTGVKSGAILAWRESGSDPNNLERKANSALLDKLTGKGRIKAGSNSGRWARIVLSHVSGLRFRKRFYANLLIWRFPRWFQHFFRIVWSSFCALRGWVRSLVSNLKVAFLIFLCGYLS